MRILILDDDDIRHTTFARVYRGNDIVHCYSYSSFLSCLSNVHWDIVHLDHDLGDSVVGDTYVDGWGAVHEYNGKHAADRICDLDEGSFPSKVIVHSVNPVGAKSIVQMLNSRGIHAVWMPFGQTLSEF